MGRLERIAAEQDRAAGRGLSRRGFLSAAAGSTLLFGFARQTKAAQLYPPGAPLPPEEFEPTIWCSVAPDGTVNVNIIRAEMGQHIGTALARIIADEMEADWDKVKITYVDTDPKWGLMVTGGSWSVWMTWDVFRQAGAAARTVLVEEGAKLLGVTPEKCVARNGMVIAGARSISFGDIVAQAKPVRSFTPDQMKNLPLKPASDRRLIGKEVKALDIPSKTDGTAIYGIDAKIDGMVYGRPKMPPTRYGSKVVSVDDSVAKKVRGYLRYIVLDDPSDTVPGWVVVLASSYPAAIRATDALKVEWTPGKTAHVMEKDILDHGRMQIDGSDGGTMIFNDRGVDDAFKRAHRVVEREYTCASVMHYQLEPMNAIARLKDGIWEIHCGNQWQTLFLPVIAKSLAVPESKVKMMSYLLGGGFGRRLNGDYAVPAALTSKAIGGKPVKLILTRSDDMMFDSIRSPSVQTVRVALDEKNTLIGMQHHAAAGWPTQVMAAAFMQKGVDGKPYDQFAIAGADHWYDCGPVRVRALSNDLANDTFRPGWLRSVSSGWTPWAAEQFWDEIAHEIGRDPVELRLSMLNGGGQDGRNKGEAPDSVGGALRQAAVLKRLAQKVEWGKPLPKDTAIGIATTFGQERGMPTWTAGAVRVRVDRKTGIVTCEKIWLVLDAGTVVDPDGAMAQTEGGALWGLSMALCEGSEIVDGVCKDRNLDTYTPLRIADVPEMDIEFVESTEKPMGLGEPGVTTIGAAIGNAIFNAVGVRLRHQPVRPADVLAALKEKSST
ncbi:xanthine dehydrogenase family protein molybdopterin-binding subunit [Acetobacter oeni]|uniref:Aldehyde dehydrogenase n=1 Tax=Acetobacter oeni TaxID=304077 RepID=A0A511XGD0_9PROT|nr:molybdopterin cofactor-binding domain-containing protein [Acetobacter oeni]MBB3881819.1 CO/xanthine dehydrogenase Mo-binding subunit [Acetobacter oeni]NHO17380.1 molybdopterin-dependent oxidoreductase [Acetobacter oeni]GBR02137.1 membrane-bound aldehyde dehydrogenase, large subunit [Acetobacter oeni LMG 21952]GEN62007.1 aldehyde dehydrogenase [Acetobacter oeni]